MSDVHFDLANRGVMIGRGGGAQQPQPPPRKLRSLGFALQATVSVPTPTGAQLANLSAPTQWHVAQLGPNDYIAITDLRSCTALAVYDPQTNISGMYHFGGQFNDETEPLTSFFLRMVNQGAALRRLVVFLSGSEKCGHAHKLVNFLTNKGMNQQPVVSEGNVSPGGATTFYLLAGGAVANTLT